MVEKKLIFIGGFPSGGTDLLKNVLNAHPAVHINGEMPFLYKLPTHLPFAVNDSYTQEETNKLLEWLSDHDIWDNLTNKESMQKSIYNLNGRSISKYQFFYELFSKIERDVWGNKTPQNSENAEILFKLFPDSKLIVVTRDVRDVVLSWKKKWGKNPYLVADKWASRMSHVHDLAQVNDRILLLKFEDLLSETERVTKGICQFIEIEWDERMLTYHKHTDTIVDGKINYGNPIKKGNKQKWKTTAKPKFIRRIEEIAFDGMEKLNYDTAHAKEVKPLSHFYKKYGIMYDVLAMLLVGNRAKENNSFKDRISEVVKQIKLKTS
ncbi:sulfotransferase family protein [Rhodohalobacter sp. 8-1]|uniref:sulfotransferase family protein n=1 Tax=Rhodohalobacter sp. 8-1 TaxID=3131972 RepID=UPI0030EF979F